jgi:hypothetical protein
MSCPSTVSNEITRLTHFTTRSVELLEKSKTMPQMEWISAVACTAFVKKIFLIGIAPEMARRGGKHL